MGVGGGGGHACRAVMATKVINHDCSIVKTGIGRGNDEVTFREDGRWGWGKVGGERGEGGGKICCMYF